MPGKNSSRARRYINAPPTSGEAFLLIFSQAGGFFAFGKALRDKCSCLINGDGGPAGAIARACRLPAFSGLLQDGP